MQVHTVRVLLYNNRSPAAVSCASFKGHRTNHKVLRGEIRRVVTAGVHIIKPRSV